MKLKKALLVVDPQNDFCPGGTLGVSECANLIKKINEYIKIFHRNNLPVFISRDWHPAKTKHFKKFGGLWPRHCVQNTKGAQFHPDLKLPKEAIILSKGMSPDEESYSAFKSLDSNRLKFVILLKLFGVQELYICGIATDYCVKSTTLDTLKEGFRVRVLVDAIRGVEVKPGDSERALAEMVERGAKQITINELKK